MKRARPPKKLTASLFCMAILFVQFGSTGNVRISQNHRPFPQLIQDFMEARGISRALAYAQILPPALKPTPKPVSPELVSFIDRVAAGQDKLIQGVYVEDAFALQVIQQPADNATYVSSESGTATQFGNAANHGVIGLLAHNYLSGNLFYQLEKGDTVYIVYGDGTYRRYRINQVAEYQKLTPSSVRSDMIELSTGQKTTTNKVFQRFYTGGDHVTFQTCLEKDGISNWGLTFITAAPIE